MSIFDFFRKSKPEEPKQEVLDEPSTPNIALDSSSYVNDSEVSLKKREFYTAVFLDRYSTGTPIMDDNEYPRYFQYDFEIKSPSKFHKKLVQDGYYKRRRQRTRRRWSDRPSVRNIWSPCIRGTGAPEAAPRRRACARRPGRSSRACRACR